ncbi:hypothetical protein BCR42DRAFT_324967 [Absidia repens]|uniref:BAG domain-containing protein n=1 Tax=Absidia repens TaxID=90262 RepID=A0A1X2ILS7_9FUNG|nr:hypothetical protein BCR42DRAFT_324967 [Absidia repens]
MKLQYNGGNLKDDQATLESLGILPYSVIVVSGDQVLNEQVQQTASGNEEEVGCLSRIRKIMAESQPLLSRVSYLEQQQQQQQQQQGDGMDAAQQQATKDELLYISEVLMRALLALDGVECPSSFTTARQERRQTVHFCQDLLDRVDGLKSWAQQQQQKL